ncbi:MAG: glycosyltransferase family 9 protein [Planctomycetota bacterium]|jgi:heptosyltransferase-2
MPNWFSDCRSLLVRAPNWLGDVVMCLPALEAVKRAAPGLRLTLALPGHLAELFSGADDVDAAMPIERGGRPVLRLARAFRREGFDSALLLPNSFGSALAVRLAGIPRRAGYARDGRSWMLTDAVACPAERRGLHQVEYYAALVDELGAECRPDRSRTVRLSAPPAARAQVASLLAAERRRPDAPLYALAPCAVGAGKEWPAEEFGRLAALLCERGAEVALTAAPDEKHRTAAVAAAARAAGGQVLDLAGRNSVAQMAALFELSAGFAGNDSGPMHLAGAMGLPTLGVFVATDPRLYTPLGPRVSVIGGPGASPAPGDAAEALCGLVRGEVPGG